MELCSNEIDLFFCNKYSVLLQDSFNGQTMKVYNRFLLAYFWLFF